MYRRGWSHEDEWKWLQLRRQTFERDNYTCQMCGRKIKIPIADHIVAIVDGGAPFDLDNIQTLCGHCNRIKTIQEAKNRLGRKRTKHEEQK